MIATLKDAGIGTAAYYRVPAHLQPAMRDVPPTVALPGTEEAARTNLALPMSPVLTRAQVDEVVAAAGALARRKATPSEPGQRPRPRPLGS